MNKEKTKEIIKFSLYKSIQNKWFIIFNLITLISAIIMINWPLINSVFESEEKSEIYQIAVLDNNNLIYDEFSENLKQIKFPENQKIEVSRISENTYTAENIEDNFIIVEVIPDNLKSFKTSIISKEGIITTIYSPIYDELFALRNDMLSQKYNLDDEALKVLQSDLDVNRIMLGVEADNYDVKEIVKLFSSAVTYFIAILLFSKIANEIVQEKQSKSSEYILTTVSEKEYLFAKIFSNVLILIIQGLLLFVYYFIAISVSNIINISSLNLEFNSTIGFDLLSLDLVSYIVALLVFNILNLILLCIIQATLSAKASSTSEAGNTISLLTFIVMAAYFVTIFALTPHTKVSGFLYFVSCIPILSAYFVPGMMIIGQATTIQIIVSLLLLVVSIPITFNFSSKIFKNGILDYKKVKKTKDSNIKDNLDKFLTKRKIKNIGFVVGLGILIYIGSQTLLSLLFGIVLPTLLNNFFTKTDITLINQLLLQVSSLGIAYYFVKAYCNKKQIINMYKQSKISKFSKFKIILISLVIIFGLQVLLSLVIYPKLDLDYNITDMFDINNDSNIISKILLIVTLALAPAIFEELFFRKAIIDFTRPHGKYFALLFSSLLFGILHMNLSQGLFAFIIGLVFGLIYLYTNDIKIPMIIHFINNGFAALAMIVSENTLVLVFLILMLFLVAGFVFGILTLVKEQSRNKLKIFFLAPLNIKAITTKYVYLFHDFIFDISMILVLIMSILTENVLR